MALREEVLLDIQAAQAQINRLESDISRLSVSVPVEITGEDKVAQLKQEIDSSSGYVTLVVDDSGAVNAEATLANVRNQLGLVDAEERQVQASSRKTGDELQDAASKGESAFTRFRQSIGPLIATLAAGLGVRELVRGFNDLTQAAIDNIDAQNAVNVIFKDSADVIDNFGRKSAQAAGLATSSFQKLVTPLGSLLQNFGLSVSESADAAVTIAQRAADLTSIFGGQVSDAVNAAASGFRQQTRPLLAYGISLDETTVKAKALELGLGGLNGELTQQEATQARVAAFLDQSAFAAGDFARTADEGANPLRRFRAELENIKGELGEKLLPALQDLVSRGGDLLPILSNLAPAFSAAASAIGRAADQIVPFVEIAGTATVVAGNLADVLSQIPLIGGPLGATFQALTAPVKLATDSFKEVQSIVSKGLSIEGLQAELDKVAEKAKASGNAVGVLDNEFRLLNQQGISGTLFLRELATAAGVSDTALFNLTQSLIQQREALGLDNNEVQRLQELSEGLLASGIFQRGGLDSADAALFNVTSRFQTLNTAASELATAGADRALINLATGVDSVTESSGLLPTVISDFGDLKRVADESGRSIVSILNSLPEDVTINFDQTETNIANVLQGLTDISDGLGEVLSPNISGVGIDETTGKITGDVETFISNLDTELGKTADFELDLSKIQVVAPNLAQSLADAGVDVAADIANSFAGDLEKAAEADALIQGTQGLAAATAEQYAGFLSTLTPAEIAAQRVFGAENFTSNAIREQLNKSALAVARDLTGFITQHLDGEVITPNLVIDLSGSTIQGGILQGGTPSGSGGSFTAPTPNLPPNFGSGGLTVNINNATTTSVETSSTQAGQTIQAVARGIQRVKG